jgi:hypothetical protein
MNEKPVKLDMNFGEALRRIAKTPKKAIDAVENKKSAQELTIEKSKIAASRSTVNAAKRSTKQT